MGYLVAAADASPASKAKAAYVCDGTDDQVEIQNALDRLESSGGVVELSEGNFHCTSPVKPGAQSTRPAAEQLFLSSARRTLRAKHNQLQPILSGSRMECGDRSRPTF